MAVKAKRQKDDREVGGEVPPVAKIVRAPHDAPRTPQVVRARPVTGALSESQPCPLPTRTVPDDAVQRVRAAAPEPEPIDDRRDGSEVAGKATDALFAVSSMRSGGTPDPAGKAIPAPEQAMGAPVSGATSRTFRPTIGSVRDNSRHAATVTISGTAAPNSWVELYDGSERIGSIMADVAGNWTKTLRSVAPGVFLFRARATDSAGSSSEFSEAYALSVPLPTGSIVRRRPPRHYLSALNPVGGLLARMAVLLFVLIGGILVASVLSDLHTARPQLLAQPAAAPHRSTPARVSLARASPLQMPNGLTAQQLDALRVVLSWRPIPYATGYLVQVEQQRYATGLSHLSISGTLQPAKRYSWWVSGMRQNRVGPRSQRAVLLLRPLPAKLWRFAPVRPPTDQVLLTLYNPNPVAADGSISVIRHGWNELKRVRIPAGGSVDVRLPTVKAPDATMVGTSLPILAQRLTTKGNAVQSAYGTPIR